MLNRLKWSESPSRGMGQEASAGERPGGSGQDQKVSAGDGEGGLISLQKEDAIN